MRDKSLGLATAMMDLNEAKLMSEARVIAEGLKVGDVLKYVLDNNPSGDLPYHSNLHMVSVAIAAFNLYTQTTKRLRQRSPKIHLENLRHVFVAGLFHDYNHSGGRLVDSENIERAVLDWQRAFSDDRERFSVGRVEDIIRATEFPWKDIPYRHTHAVIRDADFISGAETATVLAAIDGLPIELEATLGKRLTPSGMFARQPEFLNNLKLNTTVGREIWESIKPHVLKVQEEYVNLY